MAETDRPQFSNITRRKRIACWIIKATDTRSDYATHSISFGNKSYKNAVKILRYTYIVSLVIKCTATKCSVTVNFPSNVYAVQKDTQFFFQ